MDARSTVPLLFPVFAVAVSCSAAPRARIAHSADALVLTAPASDFARKTAGFDRYEMARETDALHLDVRDRAGAKLLTLTFAKSRGVRLFKNWRAPLLRGTAVAPDGDTVPFERLTVVHPRSRDVSMYQTMLLGGRTVAIEAHYDASRALKRVLMSTTHADPGRGPLTWQLLADKNRPSIVLRRPGRHAPEDFLGKWLAAQDLGDPGAQKALQSLAIVQADTSWLGALGKAFVERYGLGGARVGTSGLRIQDYPNATGGNAPPGCNDFPDRVGSCVSGLAPYGSGPSIVDCGSCISSRGAARAECASCLAVIGNNCNAVLGCGLENAAGVSQCACGPGYSPTWPRGAGTDGPAQCVCQPYRNNQCITLPTQHLGGRLHLTDDGSADLASTDEAACECATATDPADDSNAPSAEDGRAPEPDPASTDVDDDPSFGCLEDCGSPGDVGDTIMGEDDGAVATDDFGGDGTIEGDPGAGGDLGGG